jgi:hypothetical protein
MLKQLKMINFAKFRKNLLFTFEIRECSKIKPATNFENLSTDKNLHHSRDELLSML